MYRSVERQRVVDACGEVPSVELVVRGIERLRDTGYLGRFDGYLGQLGLTPEERHAVPTLDRQALRATVETAGDRAGWRASPTGHLDAADCQAVACVGDPVTESTSLPGTSPEAILDWYASLDVDVRLYVGVDPRVSDTLARALELRSHPSFAGVALVPFRTGSPVSAPEYVPVLEAVAEHDLVLWLHTSGHFRPDVAYDVGHPRHADEVLVRFPGLRLLMGHAGWPWTADACLVALRHQSAALEISTFAPKVVARPGWSLEPLFAHRHALAGRIFFASGTYTTPDRYRSLVAQLDELELGDQAECWRGAGFLSWSGAHGAGVG